MSEKAEVITEVKCSVGTIRLDDSVNYKLPTGGTKLMRVTGFGKQRSTGKQVFFGKQTSNGGRPWGYIDDVIRVIPRSKDSEEDWGDAINNPVPKVSW